MNDKIKLMSFHQVKQAYLFFFILDIFSYRQITSTSSSLNISQLPVDTTNNQIHQFENFSENKSVPPPQSICS